MSIKLQHKSKRGFTFTEMLIATGLFGITSAALCAVYLFGMRSYAALENYAQFDQISRLVMDTMTKEIRQAKQVINFSTNSFTFINGDGLSITYNFNADGQELIRTASDGSVQVLLNNCSLIAFGAYQRNNIAGTWDQYPAATNDWSETVKVVQMTWKTTLPVPGGPGVSEKIQTARVVIRKQH